MKNSAHDLKTGLRLDGYRIIFMAISYLGFIYCVFPAGIAMIWSWFATNDNHNFTNDLFLISISIEAIGLTIYLIVQKQFSKYKTLVQQHFKSWHQERGDCNGCRQLANCPSNDLPNPACLGISSEYDRCCGKLIIP
jgi:hypothetical protein